MKLIEYFKSFLEEEVNLNDSRIELLDKRVDSITTFLEGHDTFREAYISVIPQGSYAHKTIIKPVQATDEFDADILLELEEIDGWDAEDYVEGLYTVFRSSGTYREMVSRRTRCVMVNYAGDFHIDVVPYLERTGSKYITNRHDNRYELTNPEGYTGWFDDQNRIASGHLVKVVRLIKYLRDFKNTFAIKSILLNVLLGQQVNNGALLADPKCYSDVPTTLRTIMNALSAYVDGNTTLPSIMDPSETGENFSDRWDQDGYTTFRRWIIHYAKKIDEAYSEIDKDQSLNKWQEVFGSNFKAPVQKQLLVKTGSSIVAFDNTEQHLSDLGIATDLNPLYLLRIGGRVVRKPGFRDFELSTSGNQVSTGRRIKFYIARCTVPDDYEVYWKVLNRGDQAKANNKIRGQIVKGGTVWGEEPTTFRGFHYVECYIVKNGVCVAKDRQQVTIR